MRLGYIIFFASILLFSCTKEIIQHNIYIFEEEIIKNNVNYNINYNETLEETNINKHQNQTLEETNKTIFKTPIFN